MGKSFFEGIIDPVFMIYYALAAKAMSFAIDLRAGAILINFFTNRTVKRLVIHNKHLLSFD
jgi:hypothetical protein